MQTLAPYACDPLQSRGRRFEEAAAPTRSNFQRDRDRIVHSSAFRRLVYKTQVFVNHEGDLFRTRLTHSLEVAQLGRSIARSLLLDEDLVEAICLAHDLGHTPFGHAGQDALNECMRLYGGFEHNLQSLRVVDTLEERYPAFDGLNLSFETREGILKHCSRRNAEELNAREPNGVAQRFLDGTQASLEAQLCNLADAIAYNAHDVDDGVRSGLITMAGLHESVPLFARYYEAVLAEWQQLQAADAQRKLLYESIRRMLSDQVYDVIRQSDLQLKESGVDSAQDVRQCGKVLIGFSEEMKNQSQALKQFLFKRLYRHPQVMQTMESAQQVVGDLFSAYMLEPDRMKPRFIERMKHADSLGARARVVADFIAGMTDRYAVREHEQITGLRLMRD